MEHRQLPGGGGFHGYSHRVPLQPTSSAPPAGINMVSGNNGNLKNNSSAATTDDNNHECMVREQDRFMPIANVIRIMRRTLPPHAKIADDAKETIQECVSEFISFITGEANERCQREQRKTITAEDILWAMSKLGFDDYIEPLTLYLNRYREFEGDRGSIRGPDSLVKRGLDIGTSGLGGVHGYPPAGYHFVHQNGFYGAPAGAFGGFLRDGPMMTGGQSQAAAAAVNGGGAAAMAAFTDPYGQCDK